MRIPPRAAAALLVGAGGAGAATMLALVMADLGVAASPEARLGALAFALLLTAALAPGIVGTLRVTTPHPAPAQSKALVALGALLWLIGLGADLYSPDAGPGQLLAAHAAALAGGLALAAAGALRLRALRGGGAAGASRPS